MGHKHEKQRVVPPISPSIWLATFTLSLLGLALPLVMLQIFDRIIPFRATETLLVLFLGLLVVLSFEVAMKILRAAVMNAQAVRYSVEVSETVLDRVLRADEKKQASPLSLMHSFLLSPLRIRDSIAGTGRLSMIELPFSVLGLGLIWLLAGPLVLVPLAGFGILLAVAIVVKGIHRRKLTTREESDARRYHLFEQLIVHIGSVKANQLEAGLNNRYRTDQHRAARASQAVYFSSNLFQSLAQSINLGFSAAIVCAGAYLVLQRQIGAAELAACTMLNGRAAQPLMNAIQHWTSREGFTKSRETVTEALALRQKPPLPVPKSTLSARGTNVLFDEVTLRTSQSGRALLRNFSFAARGGFIGVSSGSTGNARAAFKCILGEQVPDKGHVTVNGHPAHQMRHFRGMNGIVYISDQPDTFEGSLIFNIALTDDPETVDRAYQAANILGLEENINKLPHGYQSDLRESGILMASRGFLQRVNLARALTHKPSILLIDDAISAMDTGMQLRAASVLQSYAREALVIAYDSTHLIDRFTDETVSITAPKRSRKPAPPMSRDTARGPAQHEAA